MGSILRIHLHHLHLLQQLTHFYCAISSPSLMVSHKKVDLRHEKTSGQVIFFLSYKERKERKSLLWRVMRHCIYHYTEEGHWWTIINSSIRYFRGDICGTTFGEREREYFLCRRLLRLFDSVDGKWQDWTQSGCCVNWGKRERREKKSHLHCIMQLMAPWSLTSFTWQWCG